jgi:hypothetical protein
MMIELKNGTKVYLKDEWTPSSRGLMVSKGGVATSALDDGTLVVWPKSISHSRMAADRFEILGLVRCAQYFDARLEAAMAEAEAFKFKPHKHA